MPFQLQAPWIICAGTGYRYCLQHQQPASRTSLPVPVLLTHPDRNTQNERKATQDISTGTGMESIALSCSLREMSDE